MTELPPDLGDTASPSQEDLYRRFVLRGEEADDFSAKRLYPALSVEDAHARIRRLREAAPCPCYRDNQLACPIHGPVLYD